MKIIKIFYFIIWALSVSLSSTAQPKTSIATKPKLVVGIVIDQMRWDFLYRYQERYSNNGFKRLLREGFACQNTYISYIPTVTAAGHTGIYTGSVPALHGIVGNDWLDRKTGRMVYCTEDSTVSTLGSSSKAGYMSPKNLWATTITDELRLASNFKSKVIGIALKDRGGILPAGHSANAAYWFDDLTGNWISSTYYFNALPNWVNSFNQKNLASSYLSKNWETSYPLNTYIKSTEDNNPYEGSFSGEEKPIFSHVLNKEKQGFGLLRSTPFGNTFTLDFAKEAIIQEALGASTETDFLTISLSSTDYIGHQFGPNSVEIEDTYLKLDKDLASFFTYLDEKIGKGNYTLFLSADHGAAHNPTFLSDHKIPSGLFIGNEVVKDLNLLLSKKYTSNKLISNISNYQIHFNQSEIDTLSIEKSSLKSDCIEYLRKRDEIAYAIDLEKISETSIPSELKEKLINGYNYTRSGDIQLILKPAFFQGYGKTGTTHGTWNPYDSHIPLLFMGWGIKHGETQNQTAMTDIAATLAAILHIQAPNACIGKVITEAIK